MNVYLSLYACVCIYTHAHTHFYAKIDIPFLLFQRRVFLPSPPLVHYFLSAQMSTGRKCYASAPNYEQVLVTDLHKKIGSSLSASEAGNYLLPGGTALIIEGNRKKDLCTNISLQPVPFRNTFWRKDLGTLSTGPPFLHILSSFSFITWQVLLCDWRKYSTFSLSSFLTFPQKRGSFQVYPATRQSKLHVSPI